MLILTSQFIWKASEQGQDHIQDGLAPVLTGIDTIKCKHPRQAAGHPPVIFVDTPGFKDLQHFENDGLHNIANWINEHMRVQGRSFCSEAYSETL